LGVVIAGGCVVGEQDKAFAVIAIDLDFAEIEKCAVPIPAPADIDTVAVDNGADLGPERGEIGAGLLRAFDSEGFADRFIIVRAGFDLFRERTKTLKAMGLIRARFLMRQR